MSFPKNPGLVLAISALGLVALACGSIAPPESCANTGFDEEAFDTFFNNMQIVYANTGEPGELVEGDDRGLRFSIDDQLAVLVDSKGEAEVMICVEQRKGGGQIVYNQTHTVQEGESTVPLIAFDSDPYVIRVIVKEILVKNLTFYTD
jgi:hypothetical protein